MPKLLLIRLIGQWLLRPRPPAPAPALPPAEPASDDRPAPAAAPGPNRPAQLARLGLAAALGLGYASLILVGIVVLAALLGLRHSTPGPEQPPAP